MYITNTLTTLSLLLAETCIENNSSYI